MYKSMAEFIATFGEYPIRSTHSEYYKWKFESNPYARGYLHLEHRNSHVVGSASITPKRIAILGETCLGAEIGDTFTHPSYRRQGIFTKGVTLCTKYGISNGFNVIYGTPNTLSLPGYKKKLCYTPCPFAKVKYMCKYLDVQPLERWFRRKMGTNLLSRASAHIFFRYLQFRSRLQRQQLSSNRLLLEILPVEEFTWDLDGLWGTSRKDYAFFTIRDKKYLNWRYFTNPDKYVVLAGIFKGTCLGYVIMKVSKSRNLVIGTICDFVTWEDRMDVFNLLLRQAEKKLIAMGVHYIHVMCSEKSPYFRGLFTSGYVIRSSRPVIVFAGTKDGRRVIKENTRWHFTYADSDMI